MEVRIEINKKNGKSFGIILNDKNYDFLREILIGFQRFDGYWERRVDS